MEAEGGRGSKTWRARRTRPQASRSVLSGGSHVNESARCFQERVGNAGDPEVSVTGRVERNARAQPGRGGGRGHGTSALLRPVSRPLRAGKDVPIGHCGLKNNALDLNADKFQVHRSKWQDLEFPRLSFPVCKTDIMKDIPMILRDLRCTIGLTGNFPSRCRWRERSMCPSQHTS